MPSAWLNSGIDMVFVSNLSSAEGGFSVSIPRRWLVQRGADHGTAFRHTPFDLSGQGGYALRSGGMSFGVVELPAEAVVPVEELANKLHRQYEARPVFVSTGGLRGRRDLRDIRVEVRNLRGRQWSKTTETSPVGPVIYTTRLDGTVAIFSPDGSTRIPVNTRITWQTINHARLYVVTFHTNSFSNYGPVFDRIMESFTIRS